MKIKEIKVVLEIEGPEARALGLCIGHYLEDRLNEYLKGTVKVQVGKTIQDTFFENHAILVTQLRQIWSMLGQYEMFESRIKTFVKKLEEHMATASPKKKEEKDE